MQKIREYFKNKSSRKKNLVNTAAHVIKVERNSGEAFRGYDETDYLDSIELIFNDPHLLCFDPGDDKMFPLGFSNTKWVLFRLGEFCDNPLMSMSFRNNGSILVTSEKIAGLNGRFVQQVRAEGDSGVLLYLVQGLVTISE